MSGRDGSVPRLLLILIAFVLAGSSMTLFIWETFSAFLAGKPVSGGAFLLALVLCGAFVGLSWLLARTIRSLVSGGP